MTYGKLHDLEPDLPVECATRQYRTDPGRIGRHAVIGSSTTQLRAAIQPLNCATIRFDALFTGLMQELAEGNSQIHQEIALHVGISDALDQLTSRLTPNEARVLKETMVNILFYGVFLDLEVHKHRQSNQDDANISTDCSLLYLITVTLGNFYALRSKVIDYIINTYGVSKHHVNTRHDQEFSLIKSLQQHSQPIGDSLVLFCVPRIIQEAFEVLKIYMPIDSSTQNNIIIEILNKMYNSPGMQNKPEPGAKTTYTILTEALGMQAA